MYYSLKILATFSLLILFANDYCFAEKMDYDAEKYDNGAADAQKPAKQLIQMIQDYLDERCDYDQNQTLTILDFGCGPGNTAKMLADQFPNAKIIGLDIDSEMIDFANKNYPNHKFFVQNFELPWSEWPSEFRSLYENKVDVIFSNYALHWLNDMNTFADNIQHLLTRNGLFVGNLLYCGWLQNETDNFNERNYLDMTLQYPTEMEFASKFFWSLRSFGDFHRINMEYQEPVSRFNKKFYSESFIEIPLKWYRKFLKYQMNEQEIQQLNELLKRLILKQRVVNVISTDKGEEIDLRQQLYIFKAIKSN